MSLYRILLLGVFLATLLTAKQCFASELSKTGRGLTLALSQEPSSLNSLTAESVSYTAGLMIHLQEGLMRYDRRRELAGGVAKSWQVTPQKIVFWLRDDALWSNGEPVTANDFVYAWRQLVNADTASPSANLASPIENAAAILRGELSPDALGVTALDARTLEVKLAHPCAWCLKLMTNSIFYPVNQTFYEQDPASYGTSPSRHLSNGAFVLKEWQRGQRIRLAKNARYWGSDRTEMNHLHFDYIGSDAKTALNLFRSGELSVAHLDRETIREALSLGYRMRTHPTGHLFHIQFSHLDGMLSQNEDLRKAISLVIDKDELVNRVVASPGTKIADSMFHDWLTIENTKMTSAKPPRSHQVDIEHAQQLLGAARAELGIEGQLRMTLTINDSGIYRRVAEYLQQQLKQHLDVDLVIDPQMTQMMVQKWRDGSSEMTLITWPVDVDDPMDQISFMGDPNFRSVFKGLYRGDDMTVLYYKNRDAIQLEARLDAVAKVQALFQDRVTVFPLFESYGATILNTKLRGYVWQPVRGYADYRYVTFAE